MPTTYWCTDTDTVINDPADPALAAAHWIPATMPGGVHESLLASGRIDHPYVADNADALGWIEQRAWWYRSELPVPAGEEALSLHLEGLDTVADVWLDGQWVGHGESQYLPLHIDLDDWRPRGDTAALLVRIAPPLAGLDIPAEPAEMVQKVAAFLGVHIAASAGADTDTTTPAGILSLNLAALRRRKSLASWGWDFAPHLPSIGLARPAQLVRQHPRLITGHRLHTISIDREHHSAEVGITVETGSDEPVSVQIRLTSPSGRTHEVQLTGDKGPIRGQIHVSDAQLWWTHDLGEPALYTAEITVLGQPETISTQFGIRTIMIDQPRPAELGPQFSGEPGRAFRFVLNGVPIFARGSNVVPLSMMTGSVTAQDHVRLVELAAAGNQNMLRVWGGGLYPDDAFFDACDRLGVLAWQDFMFACVDYPGDDTELVASVRQEATHQVRRLRNHPSLALWAGNNEVHAMHQAVYGDLGPGPWGYAFFHEILPRAVADNSDTAYWPGCPWADAADDPRINGTDAGDRHAWEVWHGSDVGAGTHEDYPDPGHAMHFHRYAHDTGRFISEFGLHATADLSTLRRWIGQDHMSLDDPVFLNRNKDTPRTKGFALLEVETGLPNSVEQYVVFSQAVQAEGLKFGIEHYRRRQPLTGGTLVWQLNEPWPGMTWSLLDHEAGAKPGYFAAARAFEPVLASFLRTDQGLELWVTNSGMEAVNDTWQISIETFSAGQELTEQVDATVDAGDSRVIWRMGSDQLPAQCALDAQAFAWVHQVGTGRTNRLFFAALQDLALPQVRLDSRVTRTGRTTAEVEISADGFAYFVRALSPWPGVRYSQNAVDLRAGDHVRIQVSHLPTDVDVDQITVEHYRSV